MAAQAGQKDLIMDDDLDPEELLEKARDIVDRMALTREEELILKGVLAMAERAAIVD
ncbi:MAG: hypothetical protein LBV15_03155 [Planctomycetota bacterium]|jgi:hypothetical protein|nr:hypothetical protein [Planctomycetota bacterium]